jgi:hypothetical protein
MPCAHLEGCCIWCGEAHMERATANITAPLVDLFRNYKLEMQITLVELKRLFQMFNLPVIVHVPTGK